MIAQLPIPVRRLNFGLSKDKKTTIRKIIHVVFIVIPVTCWFILLIWLMERAELFRSGPISAGLILMLAILVFSFFPGVLRLYRFIAAQRRYHQQRGEMARKAMENEINFLKAQIQPHFLFNTLNQISATVPPQHEATRELIARLADTFRYALRSTREEMVPLKDELGFIRNYLELEKERFGSRLNIRISAEGVQHVMIAPMLLQPLVENAIEHGISPSIKGGTVSIHCRQHQQKLIISVSDDAIPFEGNAEDLMKNGKGVGLRNTAIRIERIYQEMIRVQKNEQAGLTFSFAIPLTS